MGLRNPSLLGGKVTAAVGSRLEVEDSEANPSLLGGKVTAAVRSRLEVEDSEANPSLLGGKVTAAMRSRLRGKDSEAKGRPRGRFWGPPGRPPRQPCNPSLLGRK